MSYILNFLNLLIKLFFYRPDICIAVTTSFIQIILIIFVFRNLIKKTLNYKIYDFYLNALYICIYISYFIIYLSFLRYISIGNRIDLKYYYSKSIEIINNYPLWIIPICLFFILSFLLVSLSNKFFKKQLIMRYIHLRFYVENLRTIEKQIEKLTGEKTKEIFYHKIQNFLSYCFEQFTSKISDFPRQFFRYILKVIVYWHYDLDTLRKNNFELYFEKYSYILHNKQPYHLIAYLLMNEYFVYFCRHPIFILPFIFIIECFINDFVLHITLYSLFFYTICSPIFNLSHFFTRNDSLLDSVIHKRYYQDFDIFVNVKEIHEQFLLNYIKSDFKTLCSVQISPMYPIYYIFKIGRAHV